MCLYVFFFIDICFFICIFAYLCISVYTDVYILYTYVYTHTQICISTHTYTYIFFICISSYIYVRSSHTSVSIRVHTSITHIYTHALTPICAHIWVRYKHVHGTQIRKSIRTRGETHTYTDARETERRREESLCSGWREPERGEKESLSLRKL